MINNLTKVWRRYSDESNIIVYQFGKVGSTALEISLKDSIHTHMLYGNSPCDIHLSQRRSGMNLIYGRLGDFIKRVAIRQRKKIKIITIVREPISRNISMFFQDLAHWIYRYIGDGNHDNRFSGSDYLLEVFEKSFDHKYVERWFSSEFEKFTNVDLLDVDFDPSLGYKIISKGKFEIMVIRYESFNILPVAIKEFLGINIEITNHNTGDEKWYGPIYKEFKKTYKPSEYYINQMYSLRYVKKFYTDTEVDDLKAKYANN